MLSGVWTPLSISMHAYTALHAMLIRWFIRLCPKLQTFHHLFHMIYMLPHWSLDQTKLVSATSSSLRFGALVKSQKMMAHGWMTVSNCFSSCHNVVLTYMSCTGFMLKLNLNAGWRSKIAFIMRLNGSQLTFILRQRHEGIWWSLLQKGHLKVMKHMHHIKCMLGRSFLKAPSMLFPQLQSLH